MKYWITTEAKKENSPYRGTHLQYAYLEVGRKLPSIIATDLSKEQRYQLLELLKRHKKAIAWKIYDINEFSPNVCMHRILLEDNSKNNIER